MGYSIEESDMRENILQYSSLRNQRAWVALIDGVVIGFIAVVITNYFHKEGSFLRIITMVVNKNNRSEGVGKQLMQIAEDFARKMGCSHTELTSATHRKILGSHDFYKSLGYSELENTKRYFGKNLSEY